METIINVEVDKDDEHTIAISAKEHFEFGCPYCGYRSGYTPLQGGGAAMWQCGDCGNGCVVLGDGITKAPFSFGDFTPELQAHPRRGIPRHGRQDKQPEGGGEFFRSRGIGLDNCTCFVCGLYFNSIINNIAAFVQCKESGERIVKMFKRGAHLDYREREPDRVQVKIGACDRHLDKLQKLDKLVQDGIITEDKIKIALP